MVLTDLMVGKYFKAFVLGSFSV